MKTFTVALALLGIICFGAANAAPNCQYLNNISFADFYAQLVDRDPDGLVVYGQAINNDSASHVLTTVSSAEAQSAFFHIYTETDGVGPITMQPIDSIYLDAQGGEYDWVPGGNHIMLYGVFKKDMPAFGTSFQPGHTIPLTFTFSDGCQYSISQIVIRDRMHD